LTLQSELNLMNRIGIAVQLGIECREHGRGRCTTV